MRSPLSILLSLVVSACVVEGTTPAGLAPDASGDLEGRTEDRSLDQTPPETGLDPTEDTTDPLDDGRDASASDEDRQEPPILVVDGGPEGWSQDIGADQGDPALFSFVVFGDNQFATNSCTSGIPERLAIPQVVLDLEPDFVLHTGDLVDHAYEEGAYDRLVQCYEEMLAFVPLFPTMGNHDAGGGGITAYKDYLEWQLFEQNPLVWPGDYPADFPLWYEDDPTEWSTDRSNPSDRELLPSGVTFKTYYAFRHQNAYFISFEQGTRWWTQTPKPWLEQHLSAARADPRIDLIFVFMHHPMYSTVMPEISSGECIEPVRSEYEDLFRQYDVTMVFSGHVHSYDRFWVPDDGTPTRASPPPESYPLDGYSIHYLVTGGGGGPLTNDCDPFPLRQELSYQYSQARGCFYHLLSVTVEGQTVDITVLRVEGDEDEYDVEIVEEISVVGSL